MEKTPSSKISAEDVEIRKKHIYIAKKTQRLLGNFIAFPAFFKHHLQLIHQGSAFSLHPLYAQYFFKQKLIIQLPIQRIEHAMHDWVQCNAQHLHTSDYFLSNQDLLSISHPVKTYWHTGMRKNSSLLTGTTKAPKPTNTSAQPLAKANRLKNSMYCWIAPQPLMPILNASSNCIYPFKTTVY